MWNIFNRMPKPFSSGFLPECNGHSVYYMQYGNPKGIPVLSFHGGPGGSSRPKYAKLFDLKKYRFIQFDQRGCGESKFYDLLHENNTTNTIQDAERLLKYLNINTKIIVHGVSWGATLALLFAENYAEKVDNIILSSVFLARNYDVEWVRSDSERFYPDLWEQMRKQVNNENVREKYLKMLFSTNERDNLKALSYLGSYEYMLGKINPNFTELQELNQTELQSARVYFHFDRNNYFIKENQITDNCKKISQIPTLIVHNRMDFCCPIKQAWDLHKSLPLSKLIIAKGYGHSTPKLLKEVKKQIKDFLK